MMTLETPTSGGRRPILRLRGWQDEPNGENERTSESISAGPPRLRLKKSRSNNRNRSEEHTSELQSLMRISYAVFCLKKKKYDNNDTTTDTTYLQNNSVKNKNRETMKHSDHTTN